MIKLFSSVISGITGIIIVALVPKAIGPVAFGQFVYLQQFFMNVINFLDASSSIAFFTKLSANPERKVLITFYSVYSFFIFLILIFCFLFFEFLGLNYYILPEIQNTYIFYGIFFSFFTWLTQIFIKIADAYVLTVSVEFIKVVHKVLSLFLLILLISEFSLNLDVYFYFQLFILNIFIIALIVLFVRKRIFCLNVFRLNFLRLKEVAAEFISYCAPLLLYSVVALVVGLFDIWLLQKNSGSVQTGYYGLSYSLAAMCFIFTGAMTPIITREFSKSFEKRDLAAMAELFKRYIPMLYSIAAYFSVFIAFQSDNVLAIFTDDQFQEAYLVLVVMALYPIHQTYGQLSGSVFYATGQTKRYRNVGLFGMAVGLILTLFFVYIFELGAMGLALKMVITQFIAVNIQLFFNTKFLDLNMVYFIKHQIFAVALFCCAALLPSMFVDISSPTIDFLVSGVIYTLIVVLILFIFPSLFSVSRSELKDAIKKMMRRRKIIN
jgi:O-antigen/teichoic acid export membrane protein